MALGLIMIAVGCTDLWNGDEVQPKSLVTTPGQAQAQASISQRGPLGTPWPTSTPAPLATPLPAAPSRATPKIMHNLQGKTDCLACHRGGRFAVPPSHFGRKNETCQGCHSVDYSAVKVNTPDISHAVAGREACLRCHVFALEGAPAMPGEHIGRLESTCRNCHKTALPQ
ncbi:MAG: hypothetical protein EPO21_23935 [Chloroflexota bacterium]|nr:MAG: hypothetical protein EPO21_23935 [Chloroflexota bacterium]